MAVPRRTRFGDNMGALEAQNTAVVTALQTLGRFDFRGRRLLPLVRELVLPYLEDPFSRIRKAAAVTCCQLVVSNLERTPSTSGRADSTTTPAQLLKSPTQAFLGSMNAMSSSFTGKSGSRRLALWHRALIFDILLRLARSAIADSDANIRFTVHQCLFNASPPTPVRSSVTTTPLQIGKAAPTLTMSMSRATSTGGGGHLSARSVGSGVLGTPMHHGMTVSSPSDRKGARSGGLHQSHSTMSLLNQAVNTQSSTSLSGLANSGMFTPRESDLALDRRTSGGNTDGMGSPGGASADVMSKESPRDGSADGLTGTASPTALDRFLCQQEVLSILLVGLNDENDAVREVSVSLVGRLTMRNPAAALPPLRKMLIQTLSELKQYDHATEVDILDHEQSIKLLGTLDCAYMALLVLCALF